MDKTLILNVGLNSLQNANTDNNAQTFRIDTVTGEMFLVSALGVVTKIGSGYGLNTSLIPIGKLTGALIDAVGPAPSGDVPFDLILPANTYVKGIVALVSSPLVNAAPVFVNIGWARTQFGAIEVASGYVNGKSFDTVGNIAKNGTRWAGGQLKNALANTLYANLNFVNGAGAPVPNPLGWALGGGVIKLFAEVGTFGDATDLNTLLP